MEPKIELLGASWCKDSVRVKAFLETQQIPFTYQEVDISAGSADLLAHSKPNSSVLPTVLIGKKSYDNPSDETLSELLGINAEKPRVVMYGASWCPDCHRAKSFLKENDVRFQYIDIDEETWAPAELEKINSGKRIIPTFLISEGKYANPSNQILREVLQLPERDNQKVYDAAIIGAGATGLSAAIYIQRDRFDSIVLERKNIGGNAFLTEKIENYPGFIDISGPELMKRMAEQARFYGAVIQEGVEVRGFAPGNGYFAIDTTEGEVKARSIVIATGSSYKTLDIPKEKDLIGSGVHFCATCDGAFYRDREVLVIGGGNSALEEGIFLSRFAKKVKIIHRGSEFSADRTYVEKLDSIPNIETHLNQTSLAFETNEDQHFEGLKVRDNETTQESVVKADGAFIFIGQTPNTKLFKKLVNLDERGFVATQPGTVITNVAGVFAAGDVRKGATAQVAAATGEGVIAAYAVKNYLRQRP
jgi:thioredoxin reductase (NADPH)